MSGWTFAGIALVLVSALAMVMVLFAILWNIFRIAGAVRAYRRGRRETKWYRALEAARLLATPDGHVYVPLSRNPGLVAEFNAYCHPAASLPTECLRGDDTVTAAGCVCDGCQRRRNRVRRDESHGDGGSASDGAGHLNPYDYSYPVGPYPVVHAIRRSDDSGGPSDGDCHANAHDRNGDGALGHADGAGTDGDAPPDVGPESASDGAGGASYDGDCPVPDAAPCDSFSACDSGADAGGR